MIIEAKYITFWEGRHRKGHWVSSYHSMRCELNTETGKIKKQIQWRGIGFEILSSDDHYLRIGNDGIVEIYRKEEVE